MAKVTAKDKIIASTLDLMKGRGYQAVTVDEIISHAGVSKGSFYHAFKSKEELALTAMEVYGNRGWEIVANGEYRNIEDPVKRAKAFVEHVRTKCGELWKHGCLLGAIALEVAESNPKLIKKIDMLFNNLEDGGERIFTPALKARKVKKVTGKELGRHFLAIIEGGIVVSKSHSTPEYLDQEIGHFIKYLDYILEG
jgi:TetR/AcrR family transcriptional repressor of nem operon